VLFQILFIFTLYNTSNHLDQLKVCFKAFVFTSQTSICLKLLIISYVSDFQQLGASSPEEAAKWIRSLQDASQKVFFNSFNIFFTMKDFRDFSSWDSCFH